MGGIDRPDLDLLRRMHEQEQDDDDFDESMRGRDQEGGEQQREGGRSPHPNLDPLHLPAWLQPKSPLDDVFRRFG